LRGQFFIKGQFFTVTVTVIVVHGWGQFFDLTTVGDSSSSCYSHFAIYIVIHTAFTGNCPEAFCGELSPLIVGFIKLPYLGADRVIFIFGCQGHNH